MKNTDNEYWEVWKGAIGALIILAIFIIFFLTGCSFFREFDGKKDNKTELAKSDSGSVKKNELESKKDSEYEKTTYIPVMPNGDSVVINNYLPTQPQPRPYIIIQEKGRSSEQVKESNSDSAWNNKFNQLLTLFETKKTETKGGILSAGQLIGIAIIGIVLIAFVIMIIRFKNQITSIKNSIIKN